MEEILWKSDYLIGFILGLTGCRKNAFDIGEKANIEIAKNALTLSIKEGTLTKTGATLILKVF
jgi:hypothetical protein